MRKVLFFPERNYHQFILRGNTGRRPDLWSVRAYQGDVEVAETHFKGIYDPPPNWMRMTENDPDPIPVALKGYYLKVEPIYQRQGLASAMYNYAEKIFGLSIFPGDFQTDEGKQFLRNRKDVLEGMHIGSSEFQKPQVRTRQQILDDPMAPEEEIATLDLLDAVQHPNCPKAIWLSAAMVHPIDAIVSPFYALLLLEAPEEWARLELLWASSWIHNYIFTLDFPAKHAFVADCLERVVATHPTIHSDLRVMPRMWRERGTNAITEKAWREAQALAGEAESIQWDKHRAKGEDDYPLQSAHIALSRDKADSAVDCAQESFPFPKQEAVWQWRHLLRQYLRIAT